MITTPGIFKGFDVQEYFNDPCPEPSLTQSIAKALLDRSPAHAAAAHPRLRLTAEEPDDAPEKYDAAKAIGNAAHALMIGRGKTIAVGDFPNWQTKVAKEYRAAAMVSGQEPVLAKHMAKAEKMVAAGGAQLQALGWVDVFNQGAGEVVIAWKEGDLWFRALVDWMVDTTMIYDVKTTSLSCAPHMIGKLMGDAGWSIQAAFIERGLDVLDPDNRGRRTFRFIPQENDIPFALTGVELTEAVMTLGRKEVQRAIDIWGCCMETDEWPAYPAKVCFPEMPTWRETQVLAREAEAFDKRGKIPSIMGG